MFYHRNKILVVSLRSLSLFFLGKPVLCSHFKVKNYVSKTSYCLRCPFSLLLVIHRLFDEVILDLNKQNGTELNTKKHWSITPPSNR